LRTKNDEACFHASAPALVAALLALAHDADAEEGVLIQRCVPHESLPICAPSGRCDDVSSMRAT